MPVRRPETARAIPVGADRMCILTDYPHFDSNFPNVSTHLVHQVSRETAAQVLMGGPISMVFEMTRICTPARFRFSYVAALSLTSAARTCTLN
jgi:hypothetical protein